MLKVRNQSIIEFLARNDSDADVRRIAMRFLKSQSAAVEIARTDEDWTVRAAAVKSLRDEAVIAEIAENDDSANVRIEAIRRMHDNSALEECAKTDLVARVRQAAHLRLLDLFTAPTDEVGKCITNLTMQLYRHRPIETRENAADALAKIDDARALQSLVLAAGIPEEANSNHQSDGHTATAALKALASRGEKRAAPPLLSVLRNARNYETRQVWEAAVALWKIGDVEIVEEAAKTGFLHGDGRVNQLVIDMTTALVRGVLKEFAEGIEELGSKGLVDEKALGLLVLGVDAWDLWDDSLEEGMGLFPKPLWKRIPREICGVVGQSAKEVIERKASD